ncbi:MAG: hypothetical protein AAF403_03590 [Pseudomonadota bacterium]
MTDLFRVRRQNIASDGASLGDHFVYNFKEYMDYGTTGFLLNRDQWGRLPGPKLKAGPVDDSGESFIESYQVDPLEGEAGRRLSKEEWEGSQYYDDALEYQADMSPARAQYLKEDLERFRREQQILAESEQGLAGQVMGFLGGALGSIPHLENIIGGGAFKTAGKGLAQKIAYGAKQGALTNIAITGATLPFVYSDLSDRGREIGLDDAALDIGFAGGIGGLIGGGGSAARHFLDKKAVTADIDEFLTNEKITQNLKREDFTDDLKSEAWGLAETQTNLSADELGTDYSLLDIIKNDGDALIEELEDIRKIEHVKNMNEHDYRAGLRQATLCLIG